MRYIVRLTGNSEEQERALAWPGLVMVDELPGMRLVEMEPDAMVAWQAAFPDWEVLSDLPYRIPEYRFKLEP
jgi:hypothetical protein